MKKYIYYCLMALLLAGCTGAPTAPGRVATRPARVETKAPADKAPADTTKSSAPAEKFLADTTKSSAPAEKVPADTAKSSAPDDEVLKYLEEVALSGFEFGSAPEVVYKWTHDVDISVSGDLTEADRIAIDKTMKDLNELIAPRQVNLVPEGGDITIWYGPSKEFSKRLPSYTPGNMGYFSIRYGRDYSIQSATILIASELDVAARTHLVREELTQSFGFFQDSRQDPLSIFQQDWTITQTYSELDRAIIPLLYDERVKPGMSPDSVLAMFS
ncbi:MAG TPA: DUF2927 domain-containing protein [Symbiobacteriaceae bacterium]|jgi:hypothetical protein|nr:DUF2927 domain-containing protein [Symbiobacteriaceae bacterium]